jgi:hypothetical protein
VFDLDDPRKFGLLMAAAQMLAPGPGGVGGALSRAVPQGLMGYQGVKGANDRRAEEEQQRRMREFQIKQMEEQRAQQGQMRSLAQSAFGPNPNLVGGDDEGNPMPQAPGGGGMPEFAKGMMGIDPMLAMQMMPKPRAPMVLSEGARAFDDSGREIAANPRAEKKEPMWGKINPAEYTVDSVRKFAASQNHADLVPYRKPDAPDKPAKPQLYDGPEGPVWVTPPGSGQPGQTLPVTDPKGNPLSAKKRNQPVTEAQAKAKLYVGMMDDAEQSLATLKFDPTSLKNQTEIALARGDLPLIPKTLQNATAAKEAQVYAQSTFQWTEAVLRQLTGAAAPEGEVWRQVKTYWPQPGDSKEVIKRKEQARGAVTEQVRTISGDQKQQGGASGGWGIRELK